MTVFYAFGEEKESVPLPEEPFDLGSTPAAEEKQGVWNKEGQVVIPCFNDSSRGIRAVAHICVTADYIDSGEEEESAYLSMAQSRDDTAEAEESRVTLTP